MSTDVVKLAKRAARPITLGAIAVSIVLAFLYALRSAFADEFLEAWENHRERRDAR